MVSREGGSGAPLADVPNAQGQVSHRERDQEHRSQVWICAAGKRRKEWRFHAQLGYAIMSREFHVRAYVSGRNMLLSDHFGVLVNFERPHGDRGWMVLRERRTLTEWQLEGHPGLEGILRWTRGSPCSPRPAG